MTPRIILLALVIAGTAPVLAAGAQQPQTPRDSGGLSAAAPRWRDSVRYGGGPSIGAPLSDFPKTNPPASWCLQPTHRSTGDFGITGASWRDATRGWLSDVLSDTTEHGQGWRKVLGGAPRLMEGDPLSEVRDEAVCHAAAIAVHREVLGWREGPPPVVVVRLPKFLVVFPSNARYGEFGLAVGMTPDYRIRGAATW